jgi:hypothetical protein
MTRIHVSLTTKVMQEHRQQQASVEAEDSEDERNTFLHMLKMF